MIDAVTSKRFVPHGVNFPGYEYACQQGWSYGEQGTEPDEAAATAAAIASWQINAVRLPLNQDCWLGDDGLPAGSLTMNGYRQSVDNFVATLNAAGIVVIVDLHWSGPNGTVADGLRPMPDLRTPAFWASVATRFKDDRSVIFDLFNEPHSRWDSNDTRVFGLSWSCWANGGCRAPIEPDTAPVSGLGWYSTVGLNQLTAVVRNAGATQPILLSGTDYANDLRGWLAHAPADDQLIAGFHNYPIQRCRTVECWNTEIAPLSTEVPVVAAEIGQNDCGPPRHVNSFMDWADNHSIGYLAWAWWALPQLGCSNFALISGMDGTPLPPVGTAFHDHLQNLDRVVRRPSRLKIRAATWNRRILKLRVTIDPVAALRIRVRVRLVRDRRYKAKRVSRKRLITRRLSISSGKEQLRLRIPPGLRPRLVVAKYHGDRLLRAGKSRLRPASVSKLTR